MLFSTALLTLLAASASAVPAPAPFTVANLHRRQDAPIAQQIAETKAKYAQSNQLALLSIAEGLLPKTIGDVLSQLGLKQRRAAVTLTDNASGGVDIDYYGATLMGTPTQTMQQDFDTGSSDLWVPVSCSNCGSTPQYKASSSSTYKPSNTPFQIQYGSGDVNGTVSFDTVTLGGYKTSSQAFGAASSVSSQFANSPSSGLTGLAWPAIASIRNQPTLTQSLKVPVYGYSIHRSGSGRTNYLDVGALVSSRYTGSFQYTAVASKTYWQVSAKGFSVNGNTVGPSFYAAIDTGTTLLYAPSNAVSAFWAAVPGSSSNGDGSYSYPCSFSGTVGISFANTGVIKMSNANLNYYQSSSTTCVGSVIAQDFTDAYGNALAIVGDVFIKSSYVAFDVTNARVGFATAA